MNQDEQRTLIELLEEIHDPMRGNRIQHDLKDIMLIGIMSIVCGANSFTGMEIWRQTHEELLRQFLELPYGMSSHDHLTMGSLWIDVSG
jgi:Trp operon repressor